MQKISSYHQFIGIQQILEFQNVKCHTIFDHQQPKIKENFSFLKFVSTNQTLVYSINCFLRYSQSPETRVATPISDHTYPNIFQSTFNFHESILK